MLAVGPGGEHVAIVEQESDYDVLLRAPPRERLVGTYQTGYDTGDVTLLDAGRTVAVDVKQRFPSGLVKAALLRETARWLHTMKGPVNDPDWAEIEAAPLDADRRAFYKGEAPRKLERVKQ